MSVLLSLTHCLLLLQRVSVKVSPFAKLVSSFKAVFDIQVVWSILQLLYEKAFILQLMLCKHKWRLFIPIVRKKYHELSRKVTNILGYELLRVLLPQGEFCRLCFS